MLIDEKWVHVIAVENKITAKKSEYKSEQHKWSE